MKRILLAVAAVFLAWPLAAQVNYDAPERQMPEDVYSAFLSFTTLTQEQKQLKEQGAELSADKQQQLAQAKAQVKGVVVVEFGFNGCQPCMALLNALSQAGSDGVSMLQYWQNKGVRFYQVDTREDVVRRGKKLSSVWNAQTVPVLLILKDGQLMVNDFGFGSMQSRLNGFDENKSAAIVDMLKKWTDFALK